MQKGSRATCQATPIHLPSRLHSDVTLGFFVVMRRVVRLRPGVYRSSRHPFWPPGRSAAHATSASHHSSASGGAQGGPQVALHCQAGGAVPRLAAPCAHDPRCCRRPHCIYPPPIPSPAPSNLPCRRRLPGPLSTTPADADRWPPSIAPARAAAAVTLGSSSVVRKGSSAAAGLGIAHRDTRSGPPAAPPPTLRVPRATHLLSGGAQGERRPRCTAKLAARSPALPRPARMTLQSQPPPAH